MVLLALLLFVQVGHRAFLGLAILLLVVCMSAPRAFKPLVPIWFGLSEILGRVSSTILLGLIFLAVITPIGLWQRWSRRGKHTEEAFKAAQKSTFKTRNHLYGPEDLENAY